MKKGLIALAAITILTVFTVGCGTTGYSVINGMNAIETVKGFQAMGKMAEMNKNMADQRNRQFGTAIQNANKTAKPDDQAKQPDELDKIEQAAESKQ